MMDANNHPARPFFRFFSALLIPVFLFSLWACQQPELLGRPNLGPSATMVNLSPIPSEAAVSPSPNTWWPTYAPSVGTASTAIPQAAERVDLPGAVRVWLLLGAEDGQSGRTEAIHLVLFNEGLALASVVSIPSTLYVFIPGHNMQRLNTAYALGGFSLLSDTLAYNFGLRPERFVLAHATEFGWLVDDLGGVNMSILMPIREACGGIPSGRQQMNGKKLLCYVSFLSDGDEIDRARRQQQALQLLLNKAVQEGRPAKLPTLYLSYKERFVTNISLDEAIGKIPLILRLGDPARVHYFLIGTHETQSWTLPDNGHSQVLLPRANAISKTLDDALQVIQKPQALSEIVLTYEAQATSAYGMTQTAQPVPTLPTRPTPRPTARPPLNNFPSATPYP